MEDRPRSPSFWQSPPGFVANPEAMRSSFTHLQRTAPMRVVRPTTDLTIHNPTDWTPRGYSGTENAGYIPQDSITGLRTQPSLEAPAPVDGALVQTTPLVEEKPISPKEVRRLSWMPQLS